MLLSEAMNKIRYKAENLIVNDVSENGLDIMLAAMISELVHKDIQMMANEYMTNKIAGLSEELETTKKELANGKQTQTDVTSDSKGAGSLTGQSPDSQDSGATNSGQPEA